MCKKNPLLNVPMPKYLYDAKERNKAHEQLINCSGCTPRKRKRCSKKFAKQNKGTDSNKIPKEKHLIIQSRTKGHQPNPQVPQGVILRRHGFKVEVTGKKVQGRKQFKVIPIIYGRIVDRYKQAIHE